MSVDKNRHFVRDMLTETIVRRFEHLFIIHLDGCKEKSNKKIITFDIEAMSFDSNEIQIKRNENCDKCWIIFAKLFCTVLVMQYVVYSHSVIALTFQAKINIQIRAFVIRPGDYEMTDFSSAQFNCAVYYYLRSSATV